MHEFHVAPPPPQVPTGWSPYSTYYPGAVVWYGGTYWKCEVAHTSGNDSSGAPAQNLHMWTPVSSSGPDQRQAPPVYPPFQANHPSFSPPPPQAYYGAFPPPQRHQQHSTPNILSPAPLQMPARPPSASEEHDQDDSPSSQGTVTADNPDADRGISKRPSMNWDYFADKAGESLRYLTMREETHKARDKDELKDELKGKRIWKVGGIGVWAHSLDEAEEEVKRQVWREWGSKHGRDDWLKAAKTRTDFYNKESKGVKPLFMWKLVERGGHLPHDALPIGREGAGETLFAARAWHEGGLHLGKAAQHLANGVSISYGGDEHTSDIFEVLCGPADPALLKWMSFRHGEIAGVEGWQPLEGGREADGSALLVAKGIYENGEHPGKCLINDDHICVGWGGGEVWVRPFQILAYNSTSRR